MVHPRHRVPLRVRDAVVLGVGLAALEHQLHVRDYPLPAVEDVQALVCPRVYGAEVERLAEPVLLPSYHDEPRGPAIQPPPPEPLGQPGAELGLPLHPRERVQRLGRDVLQLVPLAQHIVNDEADDVLHHPVVAVERVEQRIIVRHTGQGVLCRLQRRLRAVAQPEERVRERIRNAHALELLFRCVHAASRGGLVASGQITQTSNPGEN